MPEPFLYGQQRYITQISHSQSVNWIRKDDESTVEMRPIGILPTKSTTTFNYFRFLIEMKRLYLTCIEGGSIDLIYITYSSFLRIHFDGSTAGDFSNALL
ncbi:hypothetical protein ACFX13_007266 [Malus domestica]|uniref:Uncharacterized protein n=1 Tax=Malus baccata TaxID=106549 RepID=A0A540M769_MALBA|nr:hypothetical protein C1H46_020048 [Malus baccata]